MTLVCFELVGVIVESAEDKLCYDNKEPENLCGLRAQRFLSSSYYVVFWGWWPKVWVAPTWSLGPRMTAQLLSGTCGSCSRWQGHDLALKTADRKWHLSHSSVQADDVARPDSSRVAAHVVLPQGWEQISGSMIQYSTTIWSLPPVRLSCQGAESTCWGAESREERSEGEKVVGSEDPAWAVLQQTQVVSFFKFYSSIFIFGGIFNRLTWFKIQKTQKDIKRERFPFLPYLLFFFFFKHLKIIFDWRIIALQCCVGFCHISTWISHKYYVCPLPPISLPCLLIFLLCRCDWCYRFLR